MFLQFPVTLSKTLDFVIFSCTVSSVHTVNRVTLLQVVDNTECSSNSIHSS